MLPRILTMFQTRILTYRGTISETGSLINAIAREWATLVPAAAALSRSTRDGMHFHMTMVTPTEMEAVPRDFDVNQYCREHPVVSALPIGMAHVQKNGQESWYAVMYTPWADELRQHLGLPPRTLHVTLGFLGGDLHGSDNLPACVTHWASSASLIQVVYSITAGIPGPSVQRDGAVLRCLVPAISDRTTKFLIHVADWCMRSRETFLTDLVLDLGHELLDRGIPYGVKLILHARPTIYEAGALFPTDHRAIHPSVGKNAAETTIRNSNLVLFERHRLVSQAAGTLVSPWSYRDPVIGLYWADKRLGVCRVPRNFGWVQIVCPATAAPNRLPSYLLSGSALPTSLDQLVALYSVGIRHILTVYETPLPLALKPMTLHHFAVDDRTPPSLLILEEMCAIIRKAHANSEGVLVHCQGGVGRTNTVIVAYLVQTQHLSVAEAIAQVTAQRKILLSPSQKSRLHQWWEVCNAARSNDALESQSSGESKVCTSLPVALYRPVAATNNLPPLLVLCGLAASGKSTFAAALASFSPYFVRINRDEMRVKGQCESVLLDAMAVVNQGKRPAGRGAPMRRLASGAVGKEVGAVVVDACNLSRAKRSEWVNTAHRPRAWCIYFSTSLLECKARIRNRLNHPTISCGEEGVRILDTMVEALEPPTHTSVKEEGFERLLVLDTEEDVAALLRSWGIYFSPPSPSPLGSSLVLSPEDAGETGFADNTILKFPRTPHVANLGAATRDDKICSRTELDAIVGAPTVIVEEKLDGANMGIFIHSEEMKLMVQNRSHFISGEYHAQFAPLPKWLRDHSADLWAILTPGRHVLYGEWLYATHSVKYQRLPSWFVAYDMYDRFTKSFLSRDRLANLLSTTSIPHVPLIYEGPVCSVDQLRSMVSGPSAYNDQLREGIVARVCQNGVLQSRAKLVRSDFITGTDRWNSSQTMPLNVLASKSLKGDA